MSNISRYERLIIYVFIISVLFMACGMGVDDYLSGTSDETESIVKCQTFEVSDSLQTIRLQEKSASYMLIQEYKNSGRAKVYGRRSVLLIFILAILLGFSRVIFNVCDLCRAILYRYRAYVIAYIHDMDGRKRLGFMC